MTRLTRRQRIRVRSYIHLAIVLAAAAVIIVGAVLLAHRVLGGSGEQADAAVLSSEFELEEPGAVPETTPEPTPSPEPTPQLPDVDPGSWELTLVNSTHMLTSDFIPDTMEIENGQDFDSRAVIHIKKLISDAREAGYTVYVCSGYRSYDTQYLIYWNHVTAYQQEGMTQEEAEATTRLAVNPPGCSEHQLGLAADILEYQGQDMEPHIGGSGLMLWLEEHCADYGFIIRYPEDKTDITGVEYEPWHLRYVGACAWYLMQNDLCLEEFLALYE